MTLLKLFGVLFAVNLFTIGGGYVMLPLLNQFFVEDFGWLTRQEFLDAVAIGQVTPGPLTIMNTFIGYKVAGFPGAVAAVAGSYLPSLAVVTLVTRYYMKFKGLRAVASVFRGIRPAVVGMLLAVGLNLAGISLGSPLTAAIGLASFALMAFTKVDPTLIVILAGVVGGVFLR